MVEGKFEQDLESHIQESGIKSEGSEESQTHLDKGEREKMHMEIFFTAWVVPPCQMAVARVKMLTLNS